MPPASPSAAATAVVIDRAAHCIRMTRILSADPDRVFAAWTEPLQLEKWWDPAGEPLQRCEMDLRVGGQFTFENRSHPGMPFSGIYREISPPHRLVFEAMGSIGRVLLSGTEGGTRMVVEIECATAEQLEQFIAMGVHDGTSQTLDNLVEYIAA
jgi:uncharacterized protein YndB with AHSA1/START domain